jgi:aminopeptidase N
MTDRQGALLTLASLSTGDREDAFADFFARYRDDTLVLDKWFALQATAQRADTVDLVERLAAHPSFSMTNPNRWRALVSNFAANQWSFHHCSGRGYRFVADMIMAADKVNPQVAARQVPVFGRWRRLEPRRAEAMRSELERILATSGLSRDVFEQASKSLG